jgi:hypothetical protein
VREEKNSSRMGMVQKAANDTKERKLAVRSGAEPECEQR